MFCYHYHNFLHFSFNSYKKYAKYPYLPSFRRFSREINSSRYNTHYTIFTNFHLPQNGIPCGTQVPLLLQIRRAGPRSSNPRSQEYRATVPGPTALVLNSTVLWAGAPGNPQPTDVSERRGSRI